MFDKKCLDKRASIARISPMTIRKAANSGKGIDDVAQYTAKVEVHTCNSLANTYIVLLDTSEVSVLFYGALVIDAIAMRRGTQQ